MRDTSNKQKRKEKNSYKWPQQTKVLQITKHSWKPYQTLYLQLNILAIEVLQKLTVISITKRVD